MGPLILIALCSIALVQPVRLDVNAGRLDKFLKQKASFAKIKNSLSDTCNYLSMFI